MANSGIAIQIHYTLQENERLISNSKTKSNIVAKHFANKLFSKTHNPCLIDNGKEEENLPL